MGVYPRPVRHPLPVWVAVGGTPTSVVRAGSLGLPMALRDHRGRAGRFTPLVDVFASRATRAGLELQPVGINSHTYVADARRRAADEFFPLVRRRHVRDRTRARLAADRPATSSTPCGRRTGRWSSAVPEEVAEKILAQHELFHHDRFLAQMSVGTIPHASVLRSIELFGTEVAPLVRAEVARRKAA